MAKKMSRPRYIKSHLPAFLLPDELWTIKPRIVYVARNPLDVAVSYFHHHRHVHGCKASLDEYLNALVTNQIIHQPYNEHVLEFWKIRNQENVLFLFYEDMKRDFDGEMKKIANFLKKPFTQDQIDFACDYLSFDKMKANPKINREDKGDDFKDKKGIKDNSEDFTFIRKGKVGSYKEELTEDQMKKLEKFSKHPDFDKFGFEYKF